MIKFNNTHSNNLLDQPIQLMQGKENSVDNPLFYETVAKSGSHLLVKVLCLLEVRHKQRANWNHVIGLWNKIQAGQTLKQLFPPQKKYCVLYRDPSD